MEWSTSDSRQGRGHLKSFKLDKCPMFYFREHCQCYPCAETRRLDYDTLEKINLLKHLMLLQRFISAMRLFGNSNVPIRF